MKCYMMKRHRSFELGSAKVLEGMGYVNIDVTRGVADWGGGCVLRKRPRRIEFNNRIFAEKKHIEYEKS